MAPDVRTEIQRLRATVAQSPIGLAEISPEGRFLTVNRALCRMLGRSEEAMLAMHVADATIADDIAISADAIERVWQSGQPETLEKRYQRPDGTTVHASSRLSRLEDDEGPLGILSATLDQTDRVRMEIALRQSEELLRHFGEASTDVLWIRNADTMQWEYLTAAFEKVYGLPREAALNGDSLANWIELILDEDREPVLAAIEHVLGGARQEFQYRIRRPIDGEVRWIRNIDFPMRDDSGRVTRIGGIGHDVTLLKRFEERQRLLLAELQHRVRNTLGVIRSVARRTAATSETVEDYAMHLEGRIDAFARVQTAVTRDLTGGIDLTSILAEELRAVLAEQSHDVRIDGPDVRLKPKAAESLGLAIHELATNAVKYGALSVDGGRMEIVWTVNRDVQPPVLDFCWQERGLTDLEPVPRRRGFGTELLETTLAYDLKAETEIVFRPTGIDCRIVLPLDGVLAD